MVILGEEFEKSLDYVNTINKLKFIDLDLTDIFDNIDKEKMINIEKRLTKINNYNKIYLLLSNEVLRDEFKLKIKKAE
jgi:hypothetical protein